MFTASVFLYDQLSVIDIELEILIFTVRIWQLIFTFEFSHFSQFVFRRESVCDTVCAIFIADS